MVVRLLMTLLAGLALGSVAPAWAEPDAGPVVTPAAGAPELDAGPEVKPAAATPESGVVALPPEAPALPTRTHLKLGVSLGAAGGIVVLAPYAVPLLGVDGKWDHRVGRWLLVGAHGSASIGGDKKGYPVCGYSALAVVGIRWVDGERFTADTLARGGLGSAACLPAPLLGLLSRADVVLAGSQALQWDVGGSLEADAVFPALSAELSTGVTYRQGRLRLGPRLVAVGSLALIPPGVFASATVEGVVAWDF